MVAQVMLQPEMVGSFKVGKGKLLKVCPSLLVEAMLPAVPGRELEKALNISVNSHAQEYTIGDKLGAGAFGEVRKAISKANKKRC